MEEQSINKIFESRLIESNIFSKEDIGQIERNIILYKKCYYLGLIDNT